MDYTLEQLIQILRTRLQDEDFDGDTLTMFLNQAQDEILGEDKYPFMQKIDTLTAFNEGELSLPIGYAATFKIYANAKDTERRPVNYIAPEDFFSNTNARTFVWTKYGDKIFYRLAKSDTDPNWTITHLYLTNPRPLVNDTDRSPIPAQFIEVLILGAMVRAEQLRDNFDYSQIYANQQDQLLTNMKLRYGPGNLTAANRAKLPYFGGYADERY